MWNGLGPSQESQSGNTTSDSASAMAALPWAATTAGKTSTHLHHSKPKNFADRLMRFLLKDVAPDTIWWVANGKAVAVHSRKLKQSNFLKENFNIKDYNAFIRNCNRWGFSRAKKYPVPEGVKVYECSLFQRDAPHLLLHMRMDSDVQDVFTRHYEMEQQQKRNSTACLSAPLAGGIADGQGCTSALPSIATELPPQVISGGVEGGMVNIQAILQLIRAKHGDSGQSNGVGSSQGLSQPTGPASAVPPQPKASIANAADSFLNKMDPASRKVPDPDRKSEQARDEILKEILQMLEVYLSLPVPPDSSLGNSQIPNVLHVIKIQGKVFLEDQAKKRRQQQQQEEQPLTTIESQLIEFIKNQPGSLAAAIGATTNQTVAPMPQGSLTGVVAANSSDSVGALGQQPQQAPVQQANGGGVVQRRASGGSSGEALPNQLERDVECFLRLMREQQAGEKA